MSATFCPITGTTVELVSSRWQGELVFVFSRVYWTRNEGWKRKAVSHMAEVQYSMIQRRFERRVYDIYLTNTDPIVYQYYDLGRVRTKINGELERFDKIAGDAIFPGPWPRGPSTYVPQVSASNINTPPVAPGQQTFGTTTTGGVIVPAPTTNVVIPPAPMPPVNAVPAPPGTRPYELQRAPQTPPSSSGVQTPSRGG
jgi:hypothetical protein